MSTVDDDSAEDYRHEQAYFNSISSLPHPTETAVPRYFKGMDCPDQYTCDVVYIDRLTGEEVMRYDGADPANTRFDYGATPDAEYFKREGRDIKEMIEPKQAKISIEECRQQMHFPNDLDYPDYDDEDYR